MTSFDAPFRYPLLPGPESRSVADEDLCTSFVLCSQYVPSARHRPPAIPSLLNRASPSSQSEQIGRSLVLPGPTHRENLEGDRDDEAFVGCCGGRPPGRSFFGSLRARRWRRRIWRVRLRAGTLLSRQWPGRGISRRLRLCAGPDEEALRPRLWLPRRLGLCSRSQIQILISTKGRPRGGLFCCAAPPLLRRLTAS